MRVNDQQLGIPETIYKDTKANIEAIANPVEGMIAYATDTDQIGYYNGTIWYWFSTSDTTDNDAIHDNVAGEIHAITEKTSLADNDEFVIEDSADSYNKKRVKKSNLGAGGGSGDMLKSVYDTDDDGSVDSAENADTVDGQHASEFAPASKGVTNGDSHDHSGGDGAQIDHGGLAGLGDDDHAQYLNNARHDTTARHALGTVVPHDDHGALSGLADDDHPQYAMRTGWQPDSDTWVYVAANQFKIVGKNVTARFPVGTKIKLTQTTVKYFYVVAAAYVSDTTVTVTGGTYSLANAAITSPYYSYADNPQGFPRTPGGWIYPSSPLWVGTAGSPLTSTSWNGDSYSTTAKTLIDLSAAFGVPAGVKAVLVRLDARDSGSLASTNNSVFLSPTSTEDDSALANEPRGYPNDVWQGRYGVVPCNADGDIYYRIIASGTNTMDIHIQIWGYQI